VRPRRFKVRANVHVTHLRHTQRAVRDNTKSESGVLPPPVFSQCHQAHIQGAERGPTALARSTAMIDDGVIAAKCDTCPVEFLAVIQHW